MSLLEHYRALYEYEKDGNGKMLAMLGSVPEARRGDDRFQQAVTLAGHLATCRENWLDWMDGEGRNQVAWWDARCELASLRSRFAVVEGRWTNYLARLAARRLAQEFDFSESNGENFRLPVEVQIVQLAAHAPTIGAGRSARESTRGRDGRYRLRRLVDQPEQPVNFARM